MTDPDDVLKKAGSFFSKLGSTMKSTAKHVTGIGRGNVRLELDAPRAAPGSTLRGRVTLELTEPTEAKRLVVSLRARQKVMTVSTTSSGKSVGTQHHDVYHFDCELGGTKKYESTSVSFELTVPPDALDLRPQTSSGSPFADAVRTVASALSPQAGPIEWEVVARLDIPWGRDLTSSVDVVISK
jgi:hypothetical protein